MSNKAKRAILVAVLVITGILSSACGNPGGSCNGTDAIGHITECAYRLVN